MNFDLDDPLGDLLSEGSEDSFFESDRKRTGQKSAATTTTKPSSPSSANKLKLENLFGVSSNDTKPAGPSSNTVSIPTNKRSETLPTKLAETPPKPVPEPRRPPVNPSPKPILARKDIKFDDDDDLSLDLGFDPKKPKGGKKSNILDDLLGIDEPLKLESGRMATSKIQQQSTRFPRQLTIEKDYDDLLPTTGNQSSGRIRPPLTKKESSTSLNDPLGILSTKIEPTLKKDPPRTPNKKSSPLDWLGIKDHSTEDLKSNETKEASQQDMKTTLMPASMPPSSQSQPTSVLEIMKPSMAQTAQILSATNVEAETALHSLKQQETQLMIATQMKNQEMVLMGMQKRQQDLLQQQETHFNDLLQKQMHRQSALETDIRRQQDRINSHIQILMAQPVSVGITQTVDDVDITVGQTELKRITEVELKADIKTLELEKLRLEDLVQNMKMNHEQELEFLEQSHKKQVNLLEEGIEKLELRFRNDNRNLDEYYTKKIESLEMEKSRLIESYENKMKEMEENYANIIVKLKTKYEQDLENLKDEHKNMIETIRQSKLLEFSLVEQNTSYLQTLRTATNFLENASGSLQTVKDDLHGKIDGIHKEKEAELLAKERRLQAQQDHIEKTKASIENERTALLNLVRTLESKLSTLTQTTDEEQWNLRQKYATLEAERISFERERTFAREQQSRDEKRIEDLKNYQIAEYQNWMQKIDDQREALQMEQSKLEMMTRLQKPNEAAISRVEIDSAVKVAQDAARQSDVERQRYIEMQRQYEAKNRELIDHESQLRAKQMELDQAIREASGKEKNAETATNAAKHFEQQLQKKLQILQQYFKDLTIREQKVSEEKLAISRERLEIQGLRRKVYQSRCSLCKIGERSQELSDILTRTDYNDQFGVAIAEDIPNLDVERMVNEWDFEKFEKSLDLEVAESMKKAEETRNSLNIDLENMHHQMNENYLSTDILMAKLNAIGKEPFM